MKTWRFVVGLCIAAGLSQLAFAADEDAAAQANNSSVVIDQARGADPTVNYADLLRYGPWDDRNYQLTARDIAVLPEKDYYVHGVPAFFKIQVRREMQAQGFPLGRYYHREFDKLFEMRYGGLMQNGQLKRRGLGIYSHPDPKNPPPPLYFATDPLPHAVPIEGEGPFDGTLSDNETTIEYHPTNPSLVIAGSNGSGGQRHSFSADGGVTWSSAGALPNSCCDPAMDWSPDGSVAYAATLGGTCGGGFCTQVYRSTNNGQTWAGPINLSTGSSDKEFIHVDRSPASPNFGRVYVTWHQGNVMQFARSTSESPLTFAPTQAFPAEERGIGSDITTDAAGRIYYFWPTLTDGSTEIRVLRSTDGGVSFSPSVQVYDLHGDFDFPVPSMETRRTFIYAAADADLSTGPHAGRVYVAFTDKHPSSPAGPGGAAASNHAWIQVAYSDDQGATWTTATTPHSVADVATVDRYHPWIDVDNNGVVHLGFYDTRNSTGRTGVDWYYVLSTDGGTTWIEETRVSAIVSQNIADGQEWGDYNGISASAASTVGMTWTDNRITPPATTPVQASFAGRVTNIGAGPTYVLGGGGGAFNVCAGNPLPAVNLNLLSVLGFSSAVTMSTPGINNSVFPSATFTPNPVTPTSGGAATALNVTTAGAAAPGPYTIDIQASNGGATPIVRNSSLSVNVFSGNPAAPALSTPANGATEVAVRPTLTWAALANTQSYTVEIATDAAFATIVDSGTTNTNSYQPATALNPTTTYHWRVRASNPCGTGVNSATFSFTTANLICFTGSVAIPDNNATGAFASVANASSGTITDLDVSVRITHTWPGDLDLRLTHVASNTNVTLGTRLGGTLCNVANVNATFNDEGGSTIACAASSPGITGVITPVNALSAFDTLGIASEWRLTAIDRAGQDTGTIDEFCLLATLTGVTEPPIFANGFE